MIYLEPVSLGWKPLMMSWINTLPAVLRDSHTEFIVEFLEWVVDPLLEFVRKNCKVRVYTGHLSTIMSGLWDKSAKTANCPAWCDSQCSNKYLNYSI